MLKLIITIELIAGLYNITVDGNYIITSYHHPELPNSGIQIVSVIDMEKDSIFLFENNKLKKSFLLDNFPSPKQLKITEIGFYESDEYATIAAYKCQIYYFEYHMSGYLNGGGKANIKAECYLSDIDIINKYVPNEKHRKHIAFIGADYSKFHKYNMKTIEVTHKEPTLISEVSKIEEVNEIDSIFIEVLNKLKNYKP